MSTFQSEMNNISPPLRAPPPGLMGNIDPLARGTRKIESEINTNLRQIEKSLLTSWHFHLTDDFQ
jgi:hypothetical protein